MCMLNLSRQIDIGGIEQNMASASEAESLSVYYNTTRYLDRTVMANINGNQQTRDPFLDISS